MRNFNPDRELNKIQKHNKNKILYGIIVLLIIISISSTYALYQVRHTKRIIYTTVSDFKNNKDIVLAVYVDNQKENNFPAKTDNVVFSKVVCEENKKINASWNYNTWSIDMEVEVPNKCNIYFETRYKDKSGANYPELYQGLIPVTIDKDGTIRVADLSKKWYDYATHEWANAVLVTTEKYNELTENGKLREDAQDKILTLSNGDGTNADGDILQMYVWIPRYKYQLFNTLDRGIDPQSIEIVFEGKNTQKSNGQQNGKWLTHPAFTFGETELPGIWVGKFEPSEKSKTTIGTINTANAAINNITILPNKVSITNRNISIMFQSTRDIETNNIYNLNSKEIDTHMMKNMEWGAVAYLTSSKYGIYSNNGQECMINSMSKDNCEVWTNNTSHAATSTLGDGTITGCSGTTVKATIDFNKNACADNRTWEQEGVNASTTGNVYGIYDMAGGMWEHVMGNMVDTAGNYNDGQAGFNTEEELYLDLKYYDSYQYDETNGYSHYRGHLGDATREILKVYGSGTGGWNNDASNYPIKIYPWFIHGGYAGTSSSLGFFYVGRTDGAANVGGTFRIVLTAQDPT